MTVRKYTGKAKRVRKGGRKTLRVRVRPGTVHKRGVRPVTVYKESRTSLRVTLWVIMRPVTVRK